MTDPKCWPEGEYEDFSWFNEWPINRSALRGGVGYDRTDDLRTAMNQMSEELMQAAWHIKTKDRHNSMWHKSIDENFINFLKLYRQVAHQWQKVHGNHSLDLFREITIP